VTHTTYEWFATLSEARAVEARRILELRPRYNRNCGVRKKYTSRRSPAPVSALPSGSAPVCELPQYLLPRERVLATLAGAFEPLSFAEIRRRTPGKTQSVREAIDEVLANGEAVSVKGTNGNRVVLAGREHLLERTISKQTTGILRERILTVLSDLDEPIALSGVVKRTRGKTADIMKEIQALLAEGVLIETAGPRRARLVSIPQ
jgi:predicted Zn-ribbon and HTH transcriptional regulator